MERKLTMAEVGKIRQTNFGVADTNELQSNLAGSGMTDASDKRQSAHSPEPEAATDLKASAGAFAGKVEQTWDDARDRAKIFQEDSKQYVRENPTKAVFVALGIGLVLGLIFRR
jgi:ElaB/YqjD/DUF883 family membrane-anchored ribosome-binding protein